MHKLFFYTSLLSILFISGILAQNIDAEKLQLTGNFKVDSKIILESYNNIEPAFTLDEAPSKKSPLLAGLMSAILPGSGEFYVGEYLKAAIFFAVEAALITVAVVYDNKGDDLTAQFEAFADEHWSAEKYSDYILDNWQELGLAEQCSIRINRDGNLQPWERVNWNDMNSCERMISVFSHQLPNHGEQQYFELIGKYRQYSSGWDEFIIGNSFNDVPQIMLDYAHMRGQANDAYNVAAKAVIGIYINHLLSAIDAAWSASRYNENLALKMRVQNVQLAGKVEFVPTLSIRYNF
jgi:TM2 domain-containing membrane protein YozV